MLDVAGATVRLPRVLPGAVEGEPIALGVLLEHLSVDPALGIPFGEVKVDLIENLGGETLLYARAGDGQKLTVALDGQQRVSPCARCYRPLRPRQRPRLRPRRPGALSAGAEHFVAVEPWSAREWHACDLNYLIEITIIVCRC